MSASTTIGGFLPDTIKYNLQTKAGDRFNMDVIRGDVKTLYALRLLR